MKTIPKADPPVASVSLPQVQKIVRNYGFCQSLHAGKFYAILAVSDIAKRREGVRFKCQQTESGKNTAWPPSSETGLFIEKS